MLLLRTTRPQVKVEWELMGLVWLLRMEGVMPVLPLTVAAPLVLLTALVSLLVAGLERVGIGVLPYRSVRPFLVQRLVLVHTGERSQEPTRRLCRPQDQSRQRL